MSSENRYAAWLIAAAKVAGFLGQQLGVLRFDVLTPCIRAIEATRNQAKQTKTSGQLVEGLLADFINEHRDHFTEGRIDPRGFAWTRPDPHGAVVGRLAQEKGKTTVAISKKAFSTYARENGADPQQIAKFCQERDIADKPVHLVPCGKTTRCLVYTDTASQLHSTHLHLVEADAQTAH